MPTHDEIMRTFNKAVSVAHDGYRAVLDGLREDGALDTDGRTIAARRAHGDFSEAYRAAVEQRNTELERRRELLEQEVFGAPVPDAPDGGPVYADSLARVAMASGQQLRELAALAQKGGGNRLLARTVAAVAHQRGEHELLTGLLAVDEGMGAAYGELSQMPSTEALQRSLDNAGSVIPAPTLGEVAPTPAAIQRAERDRQQAERAQADAMAAYPPLGH